MKRIISIILLSASLFANELEVDGGITATGEIQSPTIQALLEQIAQLQEQINSMQIQETFSIHKKNFLFNPEPGIINTFNFNHPENSIILSISVKQNANHLLNAGFYLSAPLLGNKSVGFSKNKVSGQVPSRIYAQYDYKWNNWDDTSGFFNCLQNSGICSGDFAGTISTPLVLPDSNTSLIYKVNVNNQDYANTGECEIVIIYATSFIED